jgi:hypothetical protein
MRHLSAERLAAVADEHPTPDEAAHLAQCGQCTQGRDAHRRLIAGAALERDRTTTPLSDWAAISARLRAEGIIRTPDESMNAGSGAAPVIPFVRTSSDDVAVAARPAAVSTVDDVAATPAPTAVTPLRRRTVPAWAMRAAAGLVLVAGGMLAGRATKPERVAQEATNTRPLTPPVTSTGVFAPVNGPSVTQSNEYRFASTDEARKAMLEAERIYRDAMQFLAENDSTLQPPVENPVEAYQQRLAALDSAVTATRQALRLAPTNPVINNYYLTSVNARETTLRQIDDALPVNERVTRF